MARRKKPSAQALNDIAGTEITTLSSADPSAYTAEEIFEDIHEEQVRNRENENPFDPAETDAQFEEESVLYPDVAVQEPRSNVTQWSLVVRTKRALRDRGVDEDTLEVYEREAFAGDLEKTYEVTRRWVRLEEPTI